MNGERLGPAADRAQLQWEAQPERAARWSGSDQVELGCRVPGPVLPHFLLLPYLALCVGSPAGLLKL